MGSRHYNYAKVKCITAARAAGITVVYGVTLAVSDHEACGVLLKWGRAWVLMANGLYIPRSS